MLLEPILAGSPADREEGSLERHWSKSSLHLWESDTFCESSDTFELNGAWSVVRQGLSYCEKQINSVCLMYLHWKVF